MPEPIDLRDLAPPEPLIRILDCLEASDGPHLFLLAREPLPLWPLLAARRWRHRVTIDERGFLVSIFRAG